MTAQFNAELANRVWVESIHRENRLRSKWNEVYGKNFMTNSRDAKVCPHRQPAREETQHRYLTRKDCHRSHKHKGSSKPTRENEENIPPITHHHHYKKLTCQRCNKHVDPKRVFYTSAVDSEIIPTQKQHEKNLACQRCDKVLTPNNVFYLVHCKHYS